HPDLALGRTKLGAATGALGASGLYKQYASTGEEALTPAANSNGAGAFFYEELPLGALENTAARGARGRMRGLPRGTATVPARSSTRRFRSGRSKIPTRSCHGCNSVVDMTPT